MSKRENYNAYMREYMLRRYHARRAKAIALLGGVCSKCNSTTDLEIDHIDRNDKSFDLGHLWSVSIARYLDELKKCQLLCVDHHRAKTLTDLGKSEAQGTHGTLSAYMYCGPPKCDECKRVKREYAIARNERIRPNRSRRAGNLPEHGERRMYIKGCRCALCRASQNDYMREYYARQKLVPKARDA